MTLLLSFVLPFLLFISYPSRMWNFDGVACAAALEYGKSLFLFHSNHLLYAYLGSYFWRLVSLCGIPRALPALQLFTSLLAAGGLAGVCHLLQRRFKDPWTALLVVLCVSVTAVVWVWSIEAQVYALGFIAIAWATDALLQPVTPRKGMKVGLLHALAVLGHIVHVLWIVPALYLFTRDRRREGRQQIQAYLTTLLLGVLLPYAWVIVAVIVPREPTDRWFFKWLMGSAALTTNSAFQWHGAGWKGVFLWAETTLHFFWGSLWPYSHTVVSSGAWVLTIFSMAGFLTLLTFSWDHRTDPLWVFSVLWLAIYGIFFTTWEPATECYRMTDAIPVAILMALGLQSLSQARLKQLYLGALCSITLALNFTTRIFPMHDVTNNGIFQEVTTLTQLTPDTSLYLTSGGLPWIYLLYFTGRSAWDVHSFLRDPDHLAKEIERHRTHMPVFVEASATQVHGVNAWLANYKLKPVSQTLPWAQLQ